MNDLQLELTRLIGKKELSFWCLVETKEMKLFTYKLMSKVYFPWDTNENRWAVICVNNTHNHSAFFNSILQQTIQQEVLEIIGHPSTLSDFHRFIIGTWKRFEQSRVWISIFFEETVKFHKAIPYDSSKDLLDQPDETLKQIIYLIKSNQ